MKLAEIRNIKDKFVRDLKGSAYDVIVANPKMGSHKEAKALPYEEARQVLIRTMEEYRTPMFRDEPQNVSHEWISNDEVKITNSRTGLEIFFYLRNVDNKQ